MSMFFQANSGVFDDINANDVIVSGSLKIGSQQKNLEQYISDQINTSNIGGGSTESSNIQTYWSKEDDSSISFGSGINVSGDSNFEKIKFGSHSIPSSGQSVGQKGQVAFDTGHFYVCIADNEWRRVGINDFYTLEVEGGSASG